MQSPSYSLFFLEIDRHIREGRFREARARIRELTASTLPREEAADAAELCRRAGLPERSLSLLHRYVYPSEVERAGMRATDAEKAEYAGALIRLYAIDEASRLLSTLGENEPKKHLFTAFARIHEWDYAGAISPLERFLRMERDSNYLRLIAKTNLANCRVETRDFDRAEREVASLLEELREREAHLLAANAYELSAKNALFSGNRRLCESRIHRARTFLSETGSGTADDFFIEKIERSLLLSSAGEGTATQASAAKAFRKFRDRAIAARQFEVARDCDRELAIAERDPDTLVKVWFGTPHAAYRAGLRNDFARISAEIPTTYAWRLYSRRKATTHGFDPDAVLKPGLALHRLFQGLVRDFYRPPTLLKLHALVFPDQAYNPRSSPDQVHQLLRRLRPTLETYGLEIGEDRGLYRFKTKQPVAVVLHEKSDGAEAFARTLENRFGAGAFSATEAARALKLSKPTLLHRLVPLLAGERVLKTGTGPQTRYRFRAPKRLEESGPAVAASRDEPHRQRRTP
jgi:hypothetical protein